MSAADSDCVGTRVRMTPIKQLDGLRGLAALAVFSTHVIEATPRLFHGALDGAGHAGVMIFFALSGYLMGRLYFGSPPTRANVARFLVRRGARVLPLFLVVVFASFAWYQLMPEYRFWPYRIVGLHRLVEHLAMIQGINVLWSVPVEIRFYLLVPLIWLAFSRVPRVAQAGMLVAIVPIYARLAALGWPNFPGNELLVALPYFLGGLAISCRVAPAAGGRPWDMAFLASLAGLLLLYPEITPFFDIPGVHYWSNPACLVLVSILLITTLRSGLAEAVLGCRPFRFLGRISYGIYLLHSVVVFGLPRVSFLHHRAYILLAISLALTLIAAQLAYVLIERPARDAINRWFDRRTPQLAKQAG